MVWDIPAQAEYKVESFGCTLSTKKKFTLQLQELIDKYAAEGWKLHSFEMILGDICVVVFFRERQGL